ncbi:MAG: zinc metallopeptidase [Chloroflexia bacterium]
MFWYFDPIYLLIVGPALLLGIIAQIMVSSAYNRYSRVPNARGLTGAEAAQHLLLYDGLEDVRLEGTAGQLSDHFDPRNNTLRLSPGVARTASLASLGIVAHEVGHAQQVHTAYAPMRFRATLVPVANIGSMAGPYLILLGLVLQWGTLAWAGVLLFGMAALFYLVTLPVELDASRRGIAMLQRSGLVLPEEVDGARKVLRAAAWTYVAALLTAVLQLLYFVLLVGGRRRD